MDAATSQPRQRIDKWLWHARIFKSRSLAAKLADSGKIRLETDGRKERIGKASQTVKPQDVLTFPRGNRVCVLRVLDIGKRRGPAPEAQLLYDDLSPPPAPKEAPPNPKTAPVPTREKGAGRPTKKDRRAMDRLRPDDAAD